LSASSDLIIRIIGIRPTKELPMDEEEIKILIDQGTEAGVIEKAGHIMERIFRLGTDEQGLL